MSQFPAVRTGAILFLSAAVFLGPARADDSQLPANLTDSQKANLKKFLAAVAKPKRFLPEKARFVGAVPDNLDPNPVPGAEVKEYLAAVVPFTAAEKKGPEKAYVYWYRPNPKQGAPGVTVRRVVDLTTGEAVGEPEVLFNHATPLSREERDEAIRLAREKSPAVRDLYAGADEKDIEATPLVQVITATGQPEGSVGDRVVTLQFRKRSTNQRVNLVVNLTKQTVRDPNAP
jgi:hypothetical protein